MIISSALSFFFVFTGIVEVWSTENAWQTKIPEVQECGALNTQLQNCWGGDFIQEAPICDDTNVLLSCAESLQLELYKCPKELASRHILESIVDNYKRIVSTVCKYHTLVEDFRVYNNCWWLSSLCAKSLTIVVDGLMGPFSCRYAQESVEMCLTAHLVSFQGNPFQPEECSQPQLADQFVQLVYDSVACGQPLQSTGFNYRSTSIFLISGAIMLHLG